MSEFLICPHCSSDLTPEDFEAGMCPYCGTRLTMSERDVPGEPAHDTPASAQEPDELPEEITWTIDGEWAVCPRCGQSYDLAEEPEYCERCVPDPDHAKYRYVYPSPERPVACVILKYEGNNTEVRCGTGQTLLGRSITPGLEGNRYVGRRHARITCTGDACTVCDLGSVNGTRLNGKKLEPYEETGLRPGDVLELDIERFVVQ